MRRVRGDRYYDFIEISLSIRQKAIPKPVSAQEGFRRSNAANILEISWDILPLTMIYRERV